MITCDDQGVGRGSSGGRAGATRGSRRGREGVCRVEEYPALSDGWSRCGHHDEQLGPGVY
eukprot:1190269-Prorocentrum_minimum.AAC.2